MTKQSIPVVDRNVSKSDKDRLGRSSAAILQRLKRGPATNTELTKIGGMRFGARLHDLRKAGHPTRSRHLVGGVWIYELEST